MYHLQKSQLVYDVSHLIHLPLPPHQQPKVNGGNTEGGDNGDGDYAGADVFDPFDLDIPFRFDKVAY